MAKGTYKFSVSSISVVIPTRNGERRLERALSQIIAQRSPYPFEIICVDSGSIDRTVEICHCYNVEVVKISPDSFNHGRARNFGIACAKGDFVILLSQDAAPYDENWMRNLVDNMIANSSVAGAYSRQIAYEDASELIKKEVGLHLTGRLERSAHFIKDEAEYERMATQERYIFCNFDNVSSCIRKSVWEKIPFPETDFAEDLEWAERVLKAGFKIVYEPRSIVFHSHRYNFISNYRRIKLHHRRVYKLFGFRPVSMLWQVLPFSVILILRDSRYLITRKRVMPLRKFKELFRLPARLFIKILAQYMGARPPSFVRQYPS